MDSQQYLLGEWDAPPPSREGPDSEELRRWDPSPLPPPSDTAQATRGMSARAYQLSQFTASKRPPPPAPGIHAEDQMPGAGGQGCGERSKVKALPAWSWENTELILRLVPFASSRQRVPRNERCRAQSHGTVVSGSLAWTIPHPEGGTAGAEALDSPAGKWRERSIQSGDLGART